MWFLGSLHIKGTANGVTGLVLFSEALSSVPYVEQHNEDIMVCLGHRLHTPSKVCMLSL